VLRTRRRSPHDREISRLALPAFGALVAEPLYVLSDTAVVGHLGTAQLGGLAVANGAILGAYALFIFLAYGTTAAVSRLIGAGEHGEAAHHAVQGLWLALGIGVVLIGLGWVSAEWVVAALGGEGDVAANALVYLRIGLFGIPAFLVTMAGAGYLRGLQNTVGPLVVALTTAVLNLAIELVLIYGFDQGIGASALATTVAQWVGAAAYVRWVLRAAGEHGAPVRPDRAAIGRLARVGVALLVRTAALRAAFTGSTAVAARIGDVDLAAHEIAMAVLMVLALGLDAIAIAGQALIGRFLGAGDVGEARAAARRMVEWGMVAGVVAGVALVALLPVLPDAFSDDHDVVARSGFVLLLVALLQPVNGVVFVLDGLLIGAGDMAFLARAMVGALVAFAPAAAAVLVLDLGIGWLWAAMGVLMVARLVPLSMRLASGAWAVPGVTIRTPGGRAGPPASRTARRRARRRPA
jgi:putative MATE family efflux protein